MVDEKMTLTFSVRNNPGVYALLLGSGVSVEAEIPSGWGVLQDLVRQIAEIEGEDADPNPIEWYEQQHGNPPQYDELLGELAQSREERQALLEGYFEPTEEEREESVKTPSVAHKSIAWLVDQEYIRVIITTNFDRLLEQAMQEQGVTPTVISTPEEAHGAPPLSQLDAVILKVNGDYKKTNIKNTPEELEAYDPAIRSMLDQVFDEYGLIVCGWSGEWDIALREAILECENRRYSTFWAFHNELEDRAEELVVHRDGIPIQIEGASAFFSDLKENIQALEGAEHGAPLTREVARERVKRYLSRRERKIDLADLIQDEAERVRDRLYDENRYPLAIAYDGDEIENRLERYESEVGTLLVIGSICAYWGEESVNSGETPLSRAVRRIGTRPTPEDNFDRRWETIRRYPGVLLLYGIGVPAIAVNNWELVQKILVETKIQESSTYSPSSIVSLNASRIGGVIPDRPLITGTATVKNRIRNQIRKPLKELFPDDNRYENLFYEFEVFADLLMYDRAEAESSIEGFVPDATYPVHFLEEIREDLDSEWETWTPLQKGLFEGMPARADAALTELESNFNPT